MKRCPYCAEEIQDQAVKCRYCGERLDRSAGENDRGGERTMGRPQRAASYDTLDAAPTQKHGPTILGGQYRILRKLGKGGMGVVYLAEDTEMGDRPVAVKVLPPELADNVRAVENLRREAITAIGLTHPNIIRLYGFHSDGDMKFLVMEYVDGQTLEQKLAESVDGTLALDETVAVIEKVAAALDYAHTRQRPVFHRDLKPSNIMIGRDGDVRLMDFGIAREMKDSYTSLTGRQDTSGTLPYMSPEQLRGKRPTAAMDVYSLGVVCYECLSGRPPFHTGELTYQILHEEPEPLEDISVTVNDALQRALAKDPGERPAEAGELVGMLAGRALPQAERPENATAPPPQRLILPKDLVAVQDAQYASLEGLASGSQEAQECQRRAVGERGLPLEVNAARTGIEFRLIPAGSFTMGSPSGEADRGSDEMQHQATLTKAFYCGKYEVTQGQWEQVMGSNPSHFTNAGRDAPVEKVSWEDCQAFVKKLCQMEGVREGSYRLLTEAEWEYACRAGTAMPFCYGTDLDSSMANFDGDHPYGAGRDGQCRKTTVKVGSFRPNAWGLYDMHGNVWEWCQDWYGEYPSGSATDPLGPASGVDRVYRGGSWSYNARYCRSANRYGGAPVSRDIILGFRLARITPSYP